MGLDNSRGRPDADRPAEDSALAAIRDGLQRLRFGSIAVTIHEGRVVQLDITEKRRFGH
ncbi:YezD family protein [Allosphingosinicella sp.]|uniref:YezD family protein n=1 Tax=Allosphingosinicella sp. TaxID=2823234 RepID=UPI002FC1BD11